MAVKVYLKGVTVFVDDGEVVKRIPSGYSNYEIKRGYIHIHNLIDNNSKSFLESDLNDEKGNSITNADDYLSGIIGSFKNGGGERTFETTQDIVAVLSDGYELKILKGFKTDLSSVPSWAWSIFKPIDKAFIGDLIHDALWVDKAGQVNYFNNSFYDARKFADKERLRWRKALAPKKRIKNYVTHYVIRLIGGLMYSKQLQIPN